MQYTYLFLSVCVSVDCVDRYTKEVHRILHILELQLRSHPSALYIVGGTQLLHAMLHVLIPLCLCL